MGHSIIEYRGRAEVMSDADAHLTPCLVVDTLRRNPNFNIAITPRVQALLARWAAAETYWIPGGIDLLLDQHLVDDADRQCLQFAIAKAIDYVAGLGPILPADLLDKVVGPDSTASYGDRAAAKAIQALRLLGQLVQVDANPTSTRHPTRR